MRARQRRNPPRSQNRSAAGADGRTIFVRRSAKTGVDHEIVGIAEIPDAHAVAVAPNLRRRIKRRIAAGQRTPQKIVGVVALAEARFAEAGQQAKLEDRAGIGARSAKRRQVDDAEIGAPDHHDVSSVDLAVETAVAVGSDHIIERIESNEAVFGAKRLLAAPDRDRIGKEHLRSGQIDGKRRHRSLRNITVDMTRAPSVA
jgi:hypothetical protein